MIPPRIRQKIQKAKEKRLTELDLSNFPDATKEEKLTEMPAEVFELGWLEHLKLSYHRLKSIPDQISQLSNLSILYLSDNQLTHLPDSFSQLSNLSQLDLSSNQLTHLPDCFSQLSNLSQLDLSYNQLTHLPDWFSQLSNLSYLNLRNNQLTRLPDWFSQLSNLSILYLRNNQLTHLPDWFSQLSNLSQLDLSSNQLTHLPDWFSQLSNLSYLNLSNNPLEDPPIEVAERGIKAIREYFRQKREAGEDTLYEAKLLIVGEGEAGKTTLAGKINDPNSPLPKPDESTHGIDVKEWHFDFRGNDCRVNIWDFGGQEIYHNTHQFFLTKRSLYLLVADSRKEHTQLDYWLNIIELLSGDSPLLIIKNEKNNRPVQINESQLRGRFENLKETLATNLADNRGLENIISHIQHCIANLDHIGSKLPKTWTRVRETLEQDIRNYISLDEYLGICQENGFRNKQDALQLSQFLHDIGVILHFQDTISSPLYKTIILKPEWGTNAVYKVVDNNNIKKKFGRFTNDDLGDIWCTEQYASMQGELLELMIKFKLCYQLPVTNQYIAPQLLDANQPYYQWDSQNNLMLRYEYDFMPKGIITRFIVEMHRYIDEPKVWRSGVILQREDTFAEVIESYNQREINIRLVGTNKRGFLAVISDKLEEIHASYHHLRVKKLVPCNSSVCENTQDPCFFEWNKLQERKRYAKPTIECDKPPFNVVSVQGLIDDITNLNKDFKKMTVSRDKIFISYSHKDKDYLDKLQVYLKPLERQGLVDRWDDTRIKAGMKWHDEIQKALDAAKIAILLVSSNFFASDFIDKDELPPLLKAAEAEGTIILAVILDSCDTIFKLSELDQYQTINPPSQPLSGMDDHQKGEVFNRLAASVLEICNEKP